jgi:hypothetical protein
MYLRFMTPPPPEAKKTEMKYVAPVIVDSVSDKHLILPPAEEVNSPKKPTMTISPLMPAPAMMNFSANRLWQYL